MKQVVGIYRTKKSVEVSFDDGFVLSIILGKHSAHEQSIYITDAILKYARGEQNA